MLKLLHENEEIVMVIRKHWFVMMRIAVIFVILILIPPLVLSLLPLVTGGFNQQVVDVFINLALSLYIMVLLIFFFLIWMDYYLDLWVITSERIIDVEQRGLFSRGVSEIPLTHVQDVTIEIRGVVETLLSFGTIKIQTAGEREFTINYVPRLYEAKDAILKYARKNRS